MSQRQQFYPIISAFVFNAQCELLAEAAPCSFSTPLAKASKQMATAQVTGKSMPPQSDSSNKYIFLLS